MKPDKEMQEILHAIGHALTDGANVENSEDARDFAMRKLKASRQNLVKNTITPGPLTFKNIGWQLAELLEDYELDINGYDEHEPPTWTTLNLGEKTKSIPKSMAVNLGKQESGYCNLVAVVDDQYGDRELTVYTTRADAEKGQAYLDALLLKAKTENVFQGKFLRAHTVPGEGLTFNVLTSEERKGIATEKNTLVFPQTIWEELETNVHQVFIKNKVLSKSGLTTNRGILLNGKPGVGKTALCTAVAEDAKQRVDGLTVVYVDSDVSSSYIPSLYQELADFDLSLVVLEDIDVSTGNRLTGGDGNSIVNFLTVLNGLRTVHSGVVTIASTNHIDHIDSAVKRAGRFDCHIEMEVPDEKGRSQILETYVHKINDKIDVAYVAKVTKGATGAELKEITTKAVILGLLSETSSTENFNRILNHTVYHTKQNRPGLYL